MNKSIVIDERFCGPENSGNGGYACGMLADFLGGEVEVRLKSPPPLNQEMRVELGDGSATLLHGDTEVATAVTTSLELAVPTPPSFEEVTIASASYPSAEEHILPTCFVCGPLREEGDGLRIFSVKLDDKPMVADIWTPNSSLAYDDNGLQSEFVWAALDCPGYFAHQMNGVQMLLGSMAGSVVQRPKVNQTMMVVAWQIGVEGRKHYSGTALFDQHGELYAKSKQVWIALKPR